jgi:HD superfamily phosphohydrolase
MENNTYPPPISSREVILYLMENFAPQNFVTIMTIVGHSMFVRLKDIKQLGPISYYFKAGSHSRYEHSFGVAYLGLTFLEKLMKTYPSLELNERSKMVFAIACLCHDLGHGPFSHTFEFAMKYQNKKKFDHEKNSIELLKKIVSDTKANLKDEEFLVIESMIKGEYSYVSEEYPPFMFEILANSTFGVDVDKMDYLMRDTKELGSEDYDFICKTVRRIIETSCLDNTMSVCYDTPNAEVIELMEYRSKMFRQYYNCNKAMSHNALAICAISEVIDTLDVHLLTDSQVLELISEKNDKEKFSYEDPFITFHTHREYPKVIQYLQDLGIGKKNWKQVQKIKTSE